MKSGNWAEISPCGLYRYGLGRCWADGPLLGWLLLNPSTADATVNDQTVRQVVFFSEREGYGGAWIANLFALRSPSPEILRKCAGDPAYATGAENDWWIARMLASIPAVVLGWGAHGGEPWALPRVRAVLEKVRLTGLPVLCLGTTAGGEPRHPCRLPRSTQMETMA